MKIATNGVYLDPTPAKQAEILADQAEIRAAQEAEEAAKAKLPRTIHPAWLRLALIEIEKLDTVNAAVASQGAAKVALWEYATTIAENDADVNAIATALSIDLGDVFDRAATIRDARQG